MPELLLVRKSLDGHTMGDRLGYRDDIQGLRAIGIVLIVIFHIWIGKVSGGVDVLFVVSGYLMTLSVTKGAGRWLWSALEFWSRTALRILPTAFLIVAAVVLFANVVGPPEERLGLARHALASLFQLENMYLKLEATDYLSRENPPNALQHFWALSLQFQFFAVLPVLVLIIRTCDQAGGRKLCMVLLASLGLASFAYALLAIDRFAPGAYFDPRARLWEFLAGMAVAMAPINTVRLGTTRRIVVSWIGFLLVVSCGFVTSRNWAFPGPVALIPVSGAVMILIAGIGGRPSSNSANRLLAWGPLVGMGRYAFTIYLWHWPILVYAMHAAGTTHLGLVAGLGVITASVALSWLTYRYFETPLRTQSKRYLLRESPGLIASALPLLSCIATAILLSAPILVHDRQLRRQAEAFISYSTSPATAADYFDRAAPWVPDLETQLISAREMVPISYIDGCHAKIEEPSVTVCEYGDPAGTYTVAILGGSHAAQWLPALQLVAERLPIRLLSITKSGCRLGQTGDTDEARSCEAWNAALSETLRALRPDAIFTTSTVSRAGEPDELPSSYPRIWRQFTDLDIKVIAVRDTPRPVIDAPTCLSQAMVSSKTCAERRDLVLSVPDPSARPWGPDIYTFDLSDAVCGIELCPYVKDGLLLYRDNSHISVPFARALAPLIAEALRDATAHFGHGELATSIGLQTLP